MNNYRNESNNTNCDNPCKVLYQEPLGIPNQNRVEQGFTEQVVLIPLNFVFFGMKPNKTDHIYNKYDQTN